MFSALASLLEATLSGDDATVSVVRFGKFNTGNLARLSTTEFLLENSHSATVVASGPEH